MTQQIPLTWKDIQNWTEVEQNKRTALYYTVLKEGIVTNNCIIL